MKDFSDKEIVECLRNRQSYVVQYLSDRYLPMIRLMVSKMGGSTEDAKDVFQDGLIIMIDKLDRNDFALTFKFKTFFYSVCENLWRSILEKRNAASNYFIRKLEDSPLKDFTEDYDENLYQKIFYDSFEKLDSGCQEMLKHYWRGSSPKEISEKLGYQYGYVRKKKCECQSKLISTILEHRDYKLIKITEEAAKSIIKDS